MISKTIPQFHRLLSALPPGIKRTAVARYHLWLQDPFAPTFHFKELRPPVWSVRINRGYRALGKRYGDLIVRFWIGPHDEYDRIIRGI